MTKQIKYRLLFINFLLKEFVAPSILLFESNVFLKCDDSAPRYISVGVSQWTCFTF